MNEKETGVLEAIFRLLLKALPKEDDRAALEALIDERERLRPYVGRFVEISDELKTRLGERAIVETGRYVVGVQIVDKPEHVVPARTERRIFVRERDHTGR
ncbi:MAG TPA: hypothetical protein VN446_06880 [Candidatus Acidoferrum sp.]|nr:hypothetical protein [Candidatus Acidoferrum sp.]